MNEQIRILQAKTALFKGLITYGEYLGVCADMIQQYENRQDLDTNWQGSDDYKALCVVSPNPFH